MKIALAQISMSKDMEINLEKSIKFIKEASLNHADLICFPEIQLTKFFPQYKDLNPEDFLIDLDSIFIKKICDACKFYNIHASPNFFVKENNNCYDMSLLINNKGEIIGKQKMVHVANFEKFYEKEYYFPSEDGFNVFNTEFGKIAIVICFDRHFPESIRTCSLKGADLILIPTANTLEEDTELFKWEIKVQAFQNSVNIAMCNRVGREDKMNFSGESIVCDINGKTLSIADDKEDLLFANINLKRNISSKNSKKYLNFRRKEFYE